MCSIDGQSGTALGTSSPGSDCTVAGKLTDFTAGLARALNRDGLFTPKTVPEDNLDRSFKHEPSGHVPRPDVKRISPGRKLLAGALAKRLGYAQLNPIENGKHMGPPGVDDAHFIHRKERLHYPNVNTKALTPESRNSISNCRSAIGFACRIS
jgi:hypothetical protein